MLAIIRIRGSTGIKPKAQKTTELFRLHKINHLVLMPEDPIVLGMLQTAKDYLTWGEIDQETLTVLLENRALFKGRKRIEEKGLKEQTGFATYKALAKSLIDGKVKYKDIKDVVPVLRMNPPRKGYEAIRKPYQMGGSAGYRGKEINELIKRMIKPGVDLNGEN